MKLVTTVAPVNQRVVCVLLEATVVPANRLACPALPDLTAHLLVPLRALLARLVHTAPTIKPSKVFPVQRATFVNLDPLLKLPALQAVIANRVQAILLLVRKILTASQ